ncbi:magnesium-transporting ATPase, P-type 1 [Variovorax paradoxus B4]|uniref:Magnesium-transporting ATPase, P-type 1 n=1 Tax=Variovorax paradoxus B4 TaxID=1246301 RepID=T1XK58_VARPD|nr:magnesium-translocating P-type ATPase [Variovorax paradoxus]AGU52946.1 magnesium-transporting ATPase, P-type 1 [Variovorax paradoxus B4]
MTLPSHANTDASVPEPWWRGAQAGATWGLSQLQADEAHARWGPNSFEPQAKRSLALQFLARLRNPLVLVLLAASTISAATGDIANAGIIVLMVLLSVTLDFVQEHRASNAAEKLRASVALRARVLRDGATLEIPVTEVMPGDLMLLSAGDRVPADGLVLEARDFFVNQSLLTGESYPVEKHPGTLEGHATELQDALNAVFMGSTVISGSARVGVMATGSHTALGEVASSIQAEPLPTAFEIGMHRFGMMIMRLTLLLVLFVLLVNVILHRPLLDSFLFAVALAVGLTPELLPMVVSVTLSRGAMRLAGRRVIVKRLASIQNLGAMDVLCTDKTGTLTEARIGLARCADADGRDSARVLMLAHLNSTFESGLKSPLDEAVLAHLMDTAAWKKIDEVPFDFERRRVSVLLDRGDARWLVVKGAPDDVLALCNRFERDEGRSLAPLDADALVQLRERCHALERQGLRVLGVAWRDVPADHPHADVRDESALVFAGFAAFIDPPKAGAGEAMAALAKSGVHVKIVSGDSELVTQHLCTLLRIPVAGVLTGREISAMDDIALRARVGRTTLFCRVNPAQKNRIILALRARGHVVGYLGDGINDAPALRSADVGLTVDSAVDVAREVADIVMLDHDLAVLHEGVLEGRRTFGNVMKYIMMGTSSNFGNMLSMAGASLLLPFLPMLPAQILLNNVLYDLSQAAIPLDRVDAADLHRPRTLDMKFIQRYMWLFGAISSAFDALTFWLLIQVLHADASLFRTAWFVESLATQVLVIFVIRTRGRPWASRPGAALSLASLFVVAAALLLPFSPLAPFFHFEPPPAIFFAWLAGMLVAYLVLAEVAKRFFYARLAGSAPSRTRRHPPRRRARP